VLAINAVMFVVELGAGIRAASLSLTGDSLDMLRRCPGVWQRLYVIHRGRKAQAVGSIQGALCFSLAIAVFARASYQLFGNNTEVHLMRV